MASTKRLAPSDAPGLGSSATGVTEHGPQGGGVWVEPERHEANSSRGRVLNISSHGSDSHGNLAAIGANSVHSGWASLGIKKSEAAASVSANQERKFAKVPVSISSTLGMNESYQWTGLAF